MKPTPASARTLTDALRRVFTMVRDQHAGRLPGLPLVKGRMAALRRAWDACPGAEAVYRAARESWLMETGVCGVGGERPCDCESAQDHKGAA